MTSSDKFPVYDVSDALSSGAVEYLGTKEKGWLTFYFEDREPSEFRILFKEGRPGTGENWAEKVASELAELLHLPHASYHLATLDENRPCVITPTFVHLEEGQELRHGNELLEGFNKEQKFKNVGHTLDAIFSALKEKKVWPPLDMLMNGLERNASEIFVGYLLFDAWIGNTDRHAENWGIITTPEGRNYLAPTFDHASSLGRNETDRTREERLKTKDKGYTVSAFVRRWAAPTYDESGNSLDMATLVKSCKARFPRATIYWVEEIAKIMAEGGKVKVIFDRIPDSFISTPAKEFAMAILKESSKRLTEMLYD